MPVDLFTTFTVAGVTIDQVRDEIGDRWDVQMLPGGIAAIPRPGRTVCRVPLLEPTPGLLLATVLILEGRPCPSLDALWLEAVEAQFPGWRIAVECYGIARWVVAKRRDKKASGTCVLIRDTARDLWGELATVEG